MTKAQSLEELTQIGLNLMTAMQGKSRTSVRIQQFLKDFITKSDEMFLLYSPIVIREFMKFDSLGLRKLVYSSAFAKGINLHEPQRAEIFNSTTPKTITVVTKDYMKRVLEVLMLSSLGQKEIRNRLTKEIRDSKLEVFYTGFYFLALQQIESVFKNYSTNTLTFIAINGWAFLENNYFPGKTQADEAKAQQLKDQILREHGIQVEFEKRPTGSLVPKVRVFFPIGSEIYNQPYDFYFNWFRHSTDLFPVATKATEFFSEIQTEGEEKKALVKSATDIDNKLHALSQLSTHRPSENCSAFITFFAPKLRQHVAEYAAMIPSSDPLPYSSASSLSASVHSTFNQPKDPGYLLRLAASDASSIDDFTQKLNAAKAQSAVLVTAHGQQTKRTALHQAVLAGQPEKLSLLVDVFAELKADTGLKDKNNKTAHELAVTYNRKKPGTFPKPLLEKLKALEAPTSSSLLQKK